MCPADACLVFKKNAFSFDLLQKTEAKPFSCRERYDFSSAPEVKLFAN